MSCDCLAECPLPWTTLTARLVIDNVYTEDESGTSDTRTWTDTIDLTVQYNRVTLASLGVAHALAQGGGIPTVPKGKFLLLSTKCCPCQWFIFFGEMPDEVSGGSRTYTSTATPGDNFTLPLTGTLPFTTAFGTQNAACGKKTWAALDADWPYGANAYALDGALAFTPGASELLSWRFNGGTYTTDDIAGFSPGFQHNGLFFYPVDIHNVSPVVEDITSEGSGYGFGDSCAAAGMTLHQEASWTLSRLPSFPSTVTISGSGSGSLTITVS